LPAAHCAGDFPKAVRAGALISVSFFAARRFTL
jgi:hypothetical protein